MSRRFRPFYVAAVAVIVVGLLGTGVVPKSQNVSMPESVPVQSTGGAEDSPEWRGPQVTASPELLNFTSSLSVLPFDVVH